MRQSVSLVDSMCLSINISTNSSTSGLLMMLSPPLLQSFASIQLACFLVVACLCRAWCVLLTTISCFFLLACGGILTELVVVGSAGQPCLSNTLLCLFAHLQTITLYHYIAGKLARSRAYSTSNDNKKPPLQERWITCNSRLRWASRYYGMSAYCELTYRVSWPSQWWWQSWSV